MTPRWIEVYLRHQNGYWFLISEDTLFASDETKILAKGDEIGFTPVGENDKYLTGGKNFYNLDAYRNVDGKELFEILESSSVFMQVYLGEDSHQPVYLANKVIIKWKN